MSETVRLNPNKLLTRVIAPVAVVALGLFALHSCEQDNERHANVYEESIDRAEDLEARILDDSSVDIIPGVLVTDGDVVMRSSPARVPTNNTALLTGNELSEQPVAITRPFPVENNLQLDEDDPVDWIGGYNDSGEPVFVGISEETLDHMTYYTLSGTVPAVICPENIEGTSQADVIIDSNLLEGNAMVIDSGDRMKRVGGVTIGEEQVSDLIASIESQGYVPTPLCD